MSDYEKILEIARKKRGLKEEGLSEEAVARIKEEVKEDLKPYKLVVEKIVDGIANGNDRIVLLGPYYDEPRKIGFEARFAQGYTTIFLPEIPFSE